MEMSCLFNIICNELSHTVSNITKMLHFVVFTFITKNLPYRLEIFSKKKIFLINLVPDTSDAMPLILIGDIAFI